MKDDGKLGFWMCVALVVGNMIGSGIFLLPASLAPYGSSSILGWVLTAAGAMVLAMVFAGLSRAFPQAEGPYAYTRMAFGDLVAFVVAWGYWVSIWVGNAAIATGAVSYLSSLVPWIGAKPWNAALVTVGFVWLLTAVNVYGVRTAGAVQVATTVMKVLPLLAVTGLGIWLVLRQDARLQQAGLFETPLSLDGVTAAATLTLWALLGLESAAVTANKVRDPERTIPRATLVGTILTAMVYVLACTAVMMVIPADKLASSTAPFADFVREFWGNPAARWMALFAAISGLGALNGWILLQGEMPYQLARRGLFPAVLGRLSPRQTPTVGLCVSSVFVTALVLTNYGKSMTEIFTFMVLLSTTATLVLYLLCSLAVIKLLSEGRMPTARGRAAGLAVVGVLGSVYALWAITGAGKEAVLWGLVLLATAVPVFFIMKARRQAAEPAPQPGA